MNVDAPPTRTEAVRRLAALGALLLGGVALVAGLFSLRGDLGRAVASSSWSWWPSAWRGRRRHRRGRARGVAGILAVVAVLGVVLVAAHCRGAWGHGGRGRRPRDGLDRPVDLCARPGPGEPAGSRHAGHPGRAARGAC